MQTHKFDFIHNSVWSSLLNHIFLPLRTECKLNRKVLLIILKAFPAHTRVQLQQATVIVVTMQNPHPRCYAPKASRLRTNRHVYKLSCESSFGWMCLLSPDRNFVWSCGVKFKFNNSFVGLLEILVVGQKRWRNFKPGPISFQDYERQSNATDIINTREDIIRKSSLGIMNIDDDFC